MISRNWGDVVVFSCRGIPGKKCGTVIVTAEELGCCRVSVYSLLFEKLNNDFVIYTAPDSQGYDVEIYILWHMEFRVPFSYELLLISDRSSRKKNHQAFYS